jgi:hypothetical protein
VKIKQQGNRQKAIAVATLKKRKPSKIERIP